ncbi:peptide deformylase [Legionella drancourtii]|uniref:Peptide deformylase n=1 Tax=Legionella drancourtii LLAP12 TaxID=658187 RepID=G9EQD6_9GAMM|nr:peptide deformylase [Legionella drancourtii]EHL30531.1 hypothetical protein LDG_7483 [Legionella drancourtii LLAP12]
MKRDFCDVVLLGNPTLRMVSKPIDDEEFGTLDLNQLSERLFHMMKIKNGLGLAAPQIGINKRAIVFGMDNHPVKKHLPPIPYTILFNPIFESTSDFIEEEYEGCLSVGDLRGKVPRHKNIIYRGYDVDGNLIEREASDLHARVVQHETDHLNGIIFLDKVTNHQSLGFHNELIKSGGL